MDVQVDVWLAVPPARSSDHLCQLLSEPERQRIEATLAPAVRAQRLWAYVLRRAALAEACGVPPAQLRLRLDDEGRARLEGDDGLGTSLSHTAGLVAFAVARDVRVGIDVERIRPRRDGAGTAKRFFHPAEAAWVAEASDRDRAFFELWTLKESLAKASDRPVLDLLGERIADDEHRRFVRLEAPATHAAALAVALPPGKRGAGVNVRNRGKITWIAESS